MQPHGRTFIRTASKIGGRTTSLYKISCRKCGNTDTVPIGTHSGTLPPEVISKKFIQRGWNVGHRIRDDMCPACIEGLKHKRKEQREQREDNVIMLPELPKELPSGPIKLADLKEIVTMAPQKAEPPPEMTKEDRRIIFAGIDDHYVDETNGYKPGWNDQKVATDLNVPVAWVRQIREDNFGPEVGEAINQEIKKLTAMLEAAVTLEGKALDMLAATTQKLTAFAKMHDDLELEAKTLREAITKAQERIMQWKK